MVGVRLPIAFPQVQPAKKRFSLLHNTQVTIASPTCSSIIALPGEYSERTFEAECCSNSAGNGPYTAYNPENKVCCSDGSTQNFLTGCSGGTPVNNYANLAKLPGL